MNEEDKEKTEQQKRNYERLLFAIAILYAQDLGIDVSKVNSYKDLEEGQKTFARKIYEEHPQFEKQVLRDERISEQQIMSDAEKLLKEDKKEMVNGVRYAKWITVGDGKVCQKCAKWDGKIVCVEGTDGRTPTVDDAIKSGALHYGCRCYLADVNTDEIPLKEPNPRRDERAQARPDLYSSSLDMNFTYSSFVSEIKL